MQVCEPCIWCKDHWQMQRLILPLSAKASSRKGGEQFQTFAYQKPAAPAKERKAHMPHVDVAGRSFGQAKVTPALVRTLGARVVVRFLECQANGCLSPPTGRTAELSAKKLYVQGWKATQSQRVSYSWKVLGNSALKQVDL